MGTRFFTIAVLAGVLLANSLFAQSYRQFRDPLNNRLVKIEVVENPSFKRSLLASTNTPTHQADEFWRVAKKEFGLTNAAASLTATGLEADSLGMAHVRYQMRHEAVPVLGATAIVHVGRNGQVSTANGQLPGWVKPDMTGSLSSGEATEAALKLFETEYGVRGIPDPGVSRVIVAPGFLKNNPQDVSSYLTWAVGASSWPQFSKIYYLDAKSGALRFEQDRMIRQAVQQNRRIQDCTANPASGNCYSSYVGNASYPLYHFGRREGESSWGPNPFYQAEDTDFVYDTLGALNLRVLARYGRSGANGQGGLGDPAKLGSPDWNVAQVYLDQFNGAGCNGAAFDLNFGGLTFCHAAVLLDVVAHEWAHALTNAKFVNVYYGQSGAINESFSDVWGELFEESQTGTADWIGAGQNPSVAGRNLAQPAASYGVALPDRFYSPNYYCGGYDEGGVHYNSTVLSHAAYLLAKGGSFNGWTIPAIGSDKLERVMYRANVYYYTANVTFHEAYLDWVQACTDLVGQHGITTADCRAVRRALQAVEMDQPGACSGLPGISFTAQPQGGARNVGEGHTFQVGVSGSGPYSYQWQRDGVDILGATDATLVLTQLHIEDAGFYVVRISSQTTSTTSAEAQLTVNLAPVNLGTVQDTPVSASLSKLLAANSSYAQYPLSLTAMDEAGSEGGTVSLAGNTLTYTPPEGFVGLDAFSYTVNNNHGSSASGEVIVTVLASTDAGQNKVVSVSVAAGNCVLRYAGIPGRSYVLQWASVSTGPWSNLGEPQPADPTGLIQFTDTTTPQPLVRFYRIRTATD
jgi:Zn-dependent metalloprotease